MTNDIGPRRHFLVACCTALGGMVTGCATMDPRAIADAINAINTNFRADYEAYLKENGTRVFKMTRAEAYDAMRVSLARIGMTVESQDPVLGYVNVYAPAPLPLSAAEWKEAADADRPRARKIIEPFVGFGSILFDFEPEGLQTVIGGTVVEVSSGTAVSYTARLREVAPPRSGVPRREYLPPTAVRMGLDKLWRELQREFDATYRRG